MISAMKNSFRDRQRAVLREAFNCHSVAHLLVDFQLGYHNPRSHAAYRNGEAVARLCRPDIPNIWVRYLSGPDARKDAFHVVPPRQEEKAFEKDNASAFSNRQLHPYLKQQGIDTLLVTGVTARCCVKGTIEDALKFRYNVLPVADGIDISDPESSYLNPVARRTHKGVVEVYGGKVIPIRRHELSALLKELRGAAPEATPQSAPAIPLRRGP